MMFSALHMERVEWQHLTLFLHGQVNLITRTRVSLFMVYAFLYRVYNSPTVLFIFKLSYSQPHYRTFS